MVRFRLLCGDFLLSNPALNLENRKTVCMGYPAMTPQGRAGKRRQKGAGNPCRENGTPNINWSKWPVDVVNDTPASAAGNSSYQFGSMPDIAAMPVGKKTTASVKRRFTLLFEELDKVCQVPYRCCFYPVKWHFPLWKVPKYRNA